MTNLLPRMVDGALQQILQAARLAPLGEHHADLAGLRFFTGRLGRGWRESRLRRSRDGIAEAGLSPRLEPRLYKGTKDHER